MSALDEQFVRLFWCIFEFDYIIACRPTHYLARLQLHTNVLFKYTYNGDNKRLRIDFDFNFLGGMHKTVSCRLWTSSLYVGISAFSNSKVLFLGVECAIYLD